MDKLFDAIDRHGSFVFWVCPNGCRDQVIWNEDKTKVVCKLCGTKSTYKRNLSSKASRADNAEPCPHCDDPDCHWLLHGAGC